MKQIYANNQTTIQLGRQGENLARQVIFDLADWIEGYGDGVVELIVRRPGDEKPYPVAVTREGSNAVWTLTATDMAVKTSFNNCGQCELRWYVGEILAKSYIWRTCVEPAMDTPAETAPPAPEQGWVDQVAATGAAAKAAAKAAKAEADRAADMADDVVRSIGEAGSCAVKQVQDATSEGVKTIRDAGSEERSSLENAGDAQIERIKDEGETQTTNAKSQADAAALSAADAAQSAQEAAESAAVYGEVVSDVTQLKQDKAEKTALAKTDRSLDALWKLNQGISYQFETDDAAAYQKTVPSGAKLASVKSIGGKTIVWNQLADVATFTGSTSNGITYTVNNGKVYATGTATMISWLNFGYSDLIKGHVYFYTGAPKEATSYGIAYIYLVESVYAKTLHGGNIITFDKDTGNYAVRGTISAGVSADNWEFDFKLIDLTQLFGSGNEPTSTDDPRIAWIEQYAVAHPEYNAGELVSADVESVVERGKNLLKPTLTTQKTVNGVTIIPLGDGTFILDGTASQKTEIELQSTSRYITERIALFCTANNQSIKMSFVKDDNYIPVDSFGWTSVSVNWTISRISVVLASGATFNGELIKPMLTTDLSASYDTFSPYHEPITYSIPGAVRTLQGYDWSAGDVCNSIERTDTGWRYVQRVGSRDYQDGDTVTDGVITYYVLDIPVITDITDLMEGVLDAITVETGGTLTFENTAKLDVPNTIEYAVKLSEVGE